MAQRKPGLTFEEHLNVAETFKLAREDIHSILYAAAYKYGKTHRITKQARLALEKLHALRELLDTEYHKVCSNENFIKHGHIYYDTITNPTKLPAVPTEAGGIQSPSS